MIRTIALPVTVAVIGLLAAMTGPQPSSAATDFYAPPQRIPHAAGTVIRSEPVTALAQIPGVPGMWPGKAQRILYSSQWQDGTSVAVSGMVIDPTAPWRGAGERPTVVIGPGTVGQGDQCAGSRNPGFPAAVSVNSNLSMATNYEVLNEYLLLTLGIRVIVTDYIGLGTPGVHTYVNRVEEANAMIDAARAGFRLLGLPTHSPVGFWGYSQGGGAAAAAAELAGQRAPELDVKGTYSGAAPADLRAVLRYIDGTLGMGAIGYAVNGLTARYPALAPEIDHALNTDGRRFLSTVAHQCFFDSIAQFGLRNTSSFTATGQSFADLVESTPRLAKAVDDQRIGRRTPNAPVLVHASRNDDAIPVAQDITLARDWCARGAQVVLNEDATTPPILPGTIVFNHGGGIFTGLPPAARFLVDRFNDVPVSGTCRLP